MEADMRQLQRLNTVLLWGAKTAKEQFTEEQHKQQLVEAHGRIRKVVATNGGAVHKTAQL